MPNLHDLLTPAPMRGTTTSSSPHRLLGEFETYAGAEHVVDRLSDDGFPVEHSRIVGNNLRSVEQVTGRLTSAQAALAGAATGAWFGLFFGLLLGMFSTGSTWLAVLAGSTAIGAAWMALFGYLAHWATKGRRDFSSVQSLEADSYSVYVDATHADGATPSAEAMPAASCCGGATQRAPGTDPVPALRVDSLPGPSVR
ncbi:MAG: general stress protein [Sporichthyaceae bacterium]